MELPVRWADLIPASDRSDKNEPREGIAGFFFGVRNFGYFFFGLGVVLLGLILYAMAIRLLH